MTEEITTPSGSESNIPRGESNGSGGASGENKNHENKVSFESHQKLLDEKKRVQERLNALEEENKKYRQTALESEGKKDELIEELRKERSTKEEEVKTLKKTFATNVLKAELAIQAKDYGCRDVDTLFKVMDLEDLRMKYVDSDLKVDADSVKKQIEAIRESKGFLFNIENPAPRDGNPSSGGSSKLSHEEWLKLPYDEQKKRMRDVKL